MTMATTTTSVEHPFVAAEPPAVSGPLTAVMFAVLIVAMLVGSLSALGVAGFAVALWPTAAVDGLMDAAGAAGDRAALDALMRGAGVRVVWLMSGVGVFALVQAAWGAFGEANVRRCCTLMILALALAAALFFAASLPQAAARIAPVL